MRLDFQHYFSVQSKKRSQICFFTPQQFKCSKKPIKKTELQQRCEAVEESRPKKKRFVSHQFVYQISEMAERKKRSFLKFLV